jgi:hypothetical protein
LGFLLKVLVLAVTAWIAAAVVPAWSSPAPRVETPDAAVEVVAPLANDAPATWLAAATSDETVVLDLLEGARTIAFHEEQVLAPDARWFEGDVEIPITATTWSLVVLEDANAWGRVTLDDGFLSGLLVTSLEAYSLDWTADDLVVLPSSRLDRGTHGTFDGPDTPEGGVRVASPDADSLGYCQGFFIGGLGPSGHLATTPTTALVTGWPSAPETILLDADKTFYDAGPGNWAARQLAVANVMDAVYNREFNLDIQVAAQHAHTTLAPIDGADSGALLDDLKAYWQSDPTQREVVFLFVNKDLESIGGGAQVIGRAWCIGGAGNPLTHYALMTVMGLGSFFQQVTMEHEVGHLYAAHHHYANCAEAVVGCTIMINAVNLVFFQEFGSVERLHIRGWADAHT